jgi:hypothetical protein
MKSVFVYEFEDGCCVRREIEAIDSTLNMTRDVKINKWTRGTQDKLIIMCNSCYLGNVKVSYGDFTY